MLRYRLQLGLLHMAVAMTLVPINSTLNRVMINEYGLPATVVALLASLPYLFSPIQVAIGAFSDRHPLMGLRRTPYIVIGLLLCVAGVSLAPLAAFTMAENFWAGLGLGVLVFGAWGMGMNFATVSYLALASEISGEKGRSRTVAVMWFMMIASIILTAVTLARLLEAYSPQRLENAFRVVGLAALILGGLGLIGLEKRSGASASSGAEKRYGWLTLIRGMVSNRQVRLFFAYLILLLAAILGQDVLLEPYAAQAFGMPVSATTRITSIWGGCVLLALLVAGWLENRISKQAVARLGAAGAAAAFGLISTSGVFASQGLFYAGVVLLGLSTGLATVSNLALMLEMTTAQNVGLFMGAWGMADALARGWGAVIGGVLRDVFLRLSANPLLGYSAVFLLEAAMLVVSLALLRRIDISEFRRSAERLTLVERMALAGEG